MDNAANEALLRFLASALNLPRRRIQLLSGHSSRRKVIHIEEITPDELITLLKV